MLWLLGSLIWARNAQLHLPSTYDRVQLAPKTRCPTKYCGCHRVKKRHWVTKQLSCILHWLCVKKSVHAAQRAGYQVANSVSKHRKLTVCENKDSPGIREGYQASKSVLSKRRVYLSLIFYIDRQNRELNPHAKIVQGAGFELKNFCCWRPIPSHTRRPQRESGLTPAPRGYFFYISADFLTASKDLSKCFSRILELPNFFRIT